MFKIVRKILHIKSKCGISIPHCHDSKCNVKEGDRKIQGTSIANNLDCTLDNSEHITISVRAKDKNGKWYLSVGTIPLDRLELGSEININTNGITKLVVR